MSKHNKRELDLTEAQEETLIEMRDHHPKPYLRERSAALLKIASGQSVREVANHGLLKSRNRKTVTRWLNRYEVDGIGGLYISRGRGPSAAVEP